MSLDRRQFLQQSVGAVIVAGTVGVPSLLAMPLQPEQPKDDYEYKLSYRQPWNRVSCCNCGLRTEVSDALYKSELGFKWVHRYFEGQCRRCGVRHHRLVNDSFSYGPTPLVTKYFRKGVVQTAYDPFTRSPSYYYFLSKEERQLYREGHQYLLEVVPSAVLDAVWFGEQLNGIRVGVRLDSEKLIKL